MKSAVKILLGLCLVPLLPLSTQAQCSGAANVCAQTLPHVVKFGGAFKETDRIPRSQTIPIRFLIYSDSSGGTALWQEVQNVQLDSQGRYEVMLGAASTEGIPAEIFSAGEPRWVAVLPLLPGQAEQARVQLVSVPYALQAENAQTLGGLPASAYVKATPTVALGAAIQTTSPLIIAGNSTEADPQIVFGSNPRSPTLSSNVNVVTTPNSIPKFYANPPLVDSQITDQNGVVSMQNLSNTLFAERFTGGVPDAIKACPANGCIIYAVAPNVNLNLGTIDPGSKAITIYLGPYTYTVNQVTLRKALKIIGMGAAGGANSVPCTQAFPCNGTTLQSINGNNPVFVLPQTSFSAATNVLLSGFRVYGSAGNTSEDGFFLDTSSNSNGGLWYSTLNDIYLQGFAGIAIHLKGRNNDFGSGCQWVLFNNVIVFRTSGGGNGLRLEGAAFELRFRNCEFDGQAAGDGTDVYIGGAQGGLNGYPLTIAFEGLIAQNAAIAVQIDGVTHLTFYGSHHEKVWGAYQINDSFGIWTQGVTISDCYFASDVGSNGGKGYLLNVATSVAKGISFVHNTILGQPDSVVAGTNLASVSYHDNMYQNVIYEGVGTGTSSAPPTSGITTQLAPATIVNIQGAHTIGLNPSSTPITTIRSTLGPGEMVTFFTIAGPTTFAPGGNINLAASITVNGSITFVWNDLGSQWIPVSQWNQATTP